VATMPAVSLTPSSPELMPEPVIQPRRRQQGGMHWLAAVALGLALLILIIVDLLRKEAEAGPPDVPKPPPGLDAKNLAQLLMDTAPKLRIGFTDDQRYGISLIGVKDPKNPKEEKKLTYGRRGETNNTVVKINDSEFVFGSTTHSRFQVKTGPRIEAIKDRMW